MNIVLFCGSEVQFGIAVFLFGWLVECKWVFGGLNFFLCRDGTVW